MTWKTDFAETDVDERQVNTTRFPLYSSRKACFFLEDADKFAFGEFIGKHFAISFATIGLDSKEDRVPISLGSKITGKEGKWNNIGLLGVGLEETKELQSDEIYVIGFHMISLMSLMWEESSHTEIQDLMKMLKPMELILN